MVRRNRTIFINMINETTLLELEWSGLSIKDIAIKMGCNRNTISRNLKSLGIIRKRVIPHPDLKIDFFKEINTKEKAYYLGFLYADGYITQDCKSLVLALSKKDTQELEKFCDIIGVNRLKIKNRTHKQGSQSISIKIYSPEFVKHIINHGCVNAKSKIIRLPNLKTKEIMLSFIMGYYDGDGIMNDAAICSGSFEFLIDIKKYLNLPFEVKKKLNVYTLRIGAECKRELIKNYPYGFLRKQSNFKNDKANKLNGVNPYSKISKISVNKSELEKLIGIHSYTELGRMFGVSDNSIRKRAKKLGIILLPRKINRELKLI